MQKKTATALSLSAVLAVSAAVGAGTFALFNDTETAGPQSITAGTIDLAPGTYAEGDKVALVNAAPGATNTVTTTFANRSTLPGTFDLSFTTTQTDGACEAEATAAESAFCGKTGEGELDEQTGLVISEAGKVVFDGTVAGLSGFNYPASLLPAGQSRSFTFAYTFKDLAAAENNKAQGDGFTVTPMASLESL